MRLVPTGVGKAKFHGDIHAKTNERGEFHFEGLEDQEYEGNIDGAVPKGTIVTRTPDGGMSFRFPDNRLMSLRPGRPAVRWEVLIYRGSRLKVAD